MVDVPWWLILKLERKENICKPKFNEEWVKIKDTNKEYKSKDNQGCIFKSVSQGVHMVLEGMFSGNDS